MLYSQTALGGAFKVSPVLHSACTLQVRQRPPRVRVQNRAFCLANMQEVWKPVPGYEGIYEVSNQGRVRNSQKRILALCNVSGGYKAVSLGKNNSKTIHRLVAAAFIGPPPTGKYLVLHGDGNPANNFVENLRYGDHFDNASDAVFHKTQVNGGRQHAAKLTVDAIYDIRNSRQRTCDLALKYGVTSACVSAVKSRKNWRHV